MVDRWTHTSPAQQVVFRPGAIDGIADLLRPLGIRRALIVTTAARAGSEAADRLATRLGRSHAATFDGVEPHVPAPVIQRGVAEVRRDDIDGLVSLGGGSATDTAKALAFFAEQEAGTPGSGFADRPVLPHIAVPTTLVGAPYTSSFAMVDPHARRTTAAGGPTTAPSAVVLDPLLTMELERAQLVASVATAASHAIDVAWSPAATPEASVLALAGLARLASVAPLAVRDLADADGRVALCGAAVLCGRARQNGGEGLQHALAQLIGARADVAYSAAHASLLEHTTRFVADAVPDRAARSVAEALGADGDPADGVRRLLSDLGGVTGLGELGATGDDLDAVARQSGSHRGVQASPRPIGESDVRALLDDAL